MAGYMRMAAMKTKDQMELSKEFARRVADLAGDLDKRAEEGYRLLYYGYAAFTPDGVREGEREGLTDENKILFFRIGPQDEEASLRMEEMMGSQKFRDDLAAIQDDTGGH